MEIYIITFIVLLSFATLEVYCNLPRKIRLSFYLISYLIIVEQIGLRWETGTDWTAYLEHFNTISDFNSTSPFYTGMEYGYSILCWLVKLFTSSYTNLLVVHSIIYFYLIFKGIRLYSPYFFITLLLFYSFTMGVTGSHRQLLAVGIILCSTHFILKKEPIKFIICVCLASLIHTTAIICLPLYFLNKEIKSYILIACIFFAIILGKTNIPLQLFSMLSNIGGIADKVLTYLEGGLEVAKANPVSAIGLLKRICFILLFFYGRDKLVPKIPHYNFMLNAYVVGLILYFLFSNSLTILVNRGSLYFNIFEPLLLGCQILLFRINKDKVIIIIVYFLLSIFYFVQSIAQYPQLFIPYKGIFINKDYSRDLE